MLKISRRKQGISSPLDGNVASTQASELDFALLEQKVMEDDAGGLGIAAALGKGPSIIIDLSHEENKFRIWVGGSRGVSF